MKQIGILIHELCVVPIMICHNIQPVTRSSCHVPGGKGKLAFFLRSSFDPKSRDRVLDSKPKKKTTFFSSKFLADEVKVVGREKNI
ncbi:hypothetical protein GBA52_011296 [Prunus armeniaca]|nr:hypothetical protein GBA52_011296 [Prunus armeniaca]